MLSQFRTLGDAVAAAWARVDHRGDDFCELATETLAAQAPAISAEELIARLVAAPWLPEQHTLDQAFGQPPITLYRHPRFYIEALFWDVGTTGIHQHGFSGAFCVLDGSSLHTRYRFDEQLAVDERLRLGQLALTSVELLERGSVRPIPSGPALIHSTFHLDTPSLTLVVRTPADGSIEYEYKPPGVAIDPRFRDPATVKRLQLLGLLHRTGSPSYLAAARAALATLALSGAFQLLLRARVHLASAADFAQLVGDAREIHGPHVEALLPAVEEEWRRLLLVELRRTVREPAHRFFLALLLNLPGRRAVLDAVSARYGASGTQERVLGWIDELSQIPHSGVATDPTLRSLIAQLLDGRSEAELLASMSEAGRAQSAALLPRICAGLRGHPVLGPLFAAPVEERRA